MAKILFATDASGVKFYPITIADAVAYIKSGSSQVRLSDFLEELEEELETATSAVTGLKSAAYKEASEFDTAGAADAVKTELIGDDEDLASEDTINGAKAYADDAVEKAIAGLAGALTYQGAVNSSTDLPGNLTSNDKGKVYVVATAGTYDNAAMEVGDYLIWNGTGWDKLNGENQVSNDATDLVIGTAVKVATVDGTAINVKQVEDMTKIEAVAVADTTDYADVTSLFTAAD